MAAIMERCDQLQVIIKSHLEGPEDAQADVEEVVQETAHEDNQEGAHVQKDIQENVQEDAARSSLRSWVVSVQTCLSGIPCDMRSILEMNTFNISCPDVTGTPLGFSDPSTLMYRVSEDQLEEGDNPSELKLEFDAKPRYHSSAAGVNFFYKLDPRLAEFVGRDILKQPKYCLTMIHSYAREKKLYHQQTIKCDSVLFKIFEKESLDRTTYGTLMKDIYKLMKRVEVKFISMSHSLSEQPLSTSLNLDVKVHNGNLFPENWKIQTDESTANLLSRTQSLRPNVRVGIKRKILKRNQSIGF